MTTSVGSVERTFTMPSPARLSLRNVSGKLTIQGGPGDTLTVKAVKQPGRGFDHTAIEMEQAADGSVRVATRYDNDLLSRLLGRHAPCRVDYTVQLPQHAALDAAYVSGAAQVTNLHGQLSVETVAGTLDLADLGGDVQIKTVSGHVRATRLLLDAPLRLKTVSGAVVVSDSRLPGLEAATTSGDLRLESALATGTYRLHTVSGNIWLRLPAGTQGLVHLSSLSGNVFSRLPEVRRRAGPATPAEAGVTLHISSVSGDVHLLDGPADTAAAPGPAADRLALLDRIARGELSVDDALKNLHA